MLIAIDVITLDFLSDTLSYNLCSYYWCNVDFRNIGSQYWCTMVAHWSANIGKSVSSQYWADIGVRLHLYLGANIEVMLFPQCWPYIWRQGSCMPTLGVNWQKHIRVTLDRYWKQIRIVLLNKAKSNQLWFFPQYPFCFPPSVSNLEEGPDKWYIKGLWRTSIFFCWRNIALGLLNNDSILA